MVSPQGEWVYTIVEDLTLHCFSTSTENLELAMDAGEWVGCSLWGMCACTVHAQAHTHLHLLPVTHKVHTHKHTHMYVYMHAFVQAQMQERTVRNYLPLLPITM